MAIHADFIDPVIFSLPFKLFGQPLAVRWYGAMYFTGFTLGSYILGKLSDKGFLQMPKKEIDRFIFWLIIGMLFGARLAYVFIYNWEYYATRISEIPMVMQGGLSFHGAVIGMCVTVFAFARRHKLHFFQVGDSLALSGSIGLFFGRMGNFINGELYGRVTDSPFGMIFKNGGPYPRHPSQLYEAVFEGIVLFSILFYLHKRVKIHGILTATFILGYGFFRYFVEFFREADTQLGYYFGRTTSMGQILCMIMVVLSIFVYRHAKKKNILISHVPVLDPEAADS
jgi:phosphatidylglycerol---prolipoprotein diacylglyceryl transferase